MRSEIISLYEGRSDVTLTTYILDDSAEMLAGKKRPAVLVCPGGAYMNCSDREGEPVALRFASMGYHAFVLRYSVYGEGKREGFPDLSKPLPVKEHSQYPAPMREIGQSLKIIREHGEDWLVDADRIAICGFSAGAHNCAMYETNWNRPVIYEYLKTEPEKIRPAAVILGYTLSDYLYMNEMAEKQGPMALGLFEASNTSFLGEAEPSDDRLDLVSPARHVTEQTPPTFLWATAGDNLVPVQHSIRMAHALADHGVPFELHIFEEGDHGLALADQTSAAVRSQINADAVKWSALADAWLKKRFAFDLPEMTEFERMMAQQEKAAKL